MTKKGLDRMESKTLCTANRRNGEKCLNYAIKGATVCRMHGGSAPQVRAAAQVRLLMSADKLMAALLKIALNEKVPLQHRLVAIRDGLDRADLGGKTSVEVTVEKGKTFEDFVGEAIIDVEAEDDEHVLDAEVIEDDEPLVPRDPAHRYEGNRHDRAVFAGVERAAERRQMAGMTGRMTEQQKLEALRKAAPAEDRSDVTRGREAYLTALDNGASVKRAQAAAERAAKGEPSTRTRRARTSEAKVGRKRPEER